MIIIYSDLLIAQDTSVISENNLDSLLQSVFNKHDITREDYEETITYYNEDLKRWEDFFDKVSEYMANRNPASTYP